MAELSEEECEFQYSRRWPQLWKLITHWMLTEEEFRSDESIIAELELHDQELERHLSLRPCNCGESRGKWQLTVDPDGGSWYTPLDTDALNEIENCPEIPVQFATITEYYTKFKKFIYIEFQRRGTYQIKVNGEWDAVADGERGIRGLYNTGAGSVILPGVVTPAPGVTDVAHYQSTTFETLFVLPGDIFIPQFYWNNATGGSPGWTGFISIEAVACCGEERKSPPA